MSTHDADLPTVHPGKDLRGSQPSEEVAPLSCTEVNRLLVREQLVELEDRVIALQNESARLSSMASAREAYVAALRAPVGAAAEVLAPTRAPAVQIADLAALANDGDEVAAFFSGAVADEPARAWLLDHK